MHERTTTELRSLSNNRVGVEHGFGKLKEKFPYLTHNHHKQKILATSPGLTWRACVLLCNMHTCLAGGHGNAKYRLFPPKLDKYLKGEPDCD